MPTFFRLTTSSPERGAGGKSNAIASRRFGGDAPAETAKAAGPRLFDHYLDPVDGTACVPAGISPGELAAISAPKGFRFPLLVDDPAAEGDRFALGVGDADAHRAAHVGPLGAVVHLDQQGERVAGAALGTKGFGRRQLVQVEAHHSMPENAAGVGAGRQARREHAGGDALAHGESESAGVPNAGREFQFRSGRTADEK